METKRICVSVLQSEKNFLEQYNLSPTSLLKMKIIELKANFDEFAAKELFKANEKIKHMSEIMDRQAELIQKHDLTNEFLGLTK